MSFKTVRKPWVVNSVSHAIILKVAMKVILLTKPRRNSSVREEQSCKLTHSSSLHHVHVMIYHLSFKLKELDPIFTKLSFQFHYRGHH